MNSLAPITRILVHHRAEIAHEWTHESMRIWARAYPGLIHQEEQLLQAELILEQLSRIFAGDLGDTPARMIASSPLAEVARDFGADCAKKAFKPKDCGQFLLVLKNILSRHLADSANGTAKQIGKCSRIVDEVLDCLSLLAFETFVETRERLIAEQNQAMTEVTMPVVLLWNSVLLMQLVGMMDTTKARLFTERLLEAITRHGASVALVDLSGVPLFDNSVARHIMRAVEAAQVLGSRIVMIGISQDLTQAGIDFSSVISRTTMRAGVAEALRLVGRRIDTVAVSAR
ncbi:MAG: STAS domain-containing protein [Methylomonas sp.]|nr:STAS domain-containing protein [Methylomonas sp.]